VVVQRRALFVTEPIRGVLRDREITVREDFPNPLGEALITTYISGGYVSVSLKGDPDDNHPDLERMHTVDEVWLFCFRKFRSNQWRLMGRFTALDTFVALRLYRRSELGGQNYERNAFEFQVCWETVFPDAPIVRGDKWSDYLSGTVKDVDSTQPF
jgi:hypothetical protein